MPSISDFFSDQILAINCPVIISDPQIAKFMGPTWGPHWFCRPQMGPMLAPWTLLSGERYLRDNIYLITGTHHGFHQISGTQTWYDIGNMNCSHCSHISQCWPLYIPDYNGSILGCCWCFKIAKFGHVLTCRDYRCSFIEHRWWICSHCHHLLTQADVAASVAAYVGWHFLDELPLDILLQVLRL